jgi:hypothetical protein
MLCAATSVPAAHWETTRVWRPSRKDGAESSNHRNLAPREPGRCEYVVRGTLNRPDPASPLRENRIPDLTPRSAFWRIAARNDAVALSNEANDGRLHGTNPVAQNDELWKSR